MMRGGFRVMTGKGGGGVTVMRGDDASWNNPFRDLIPYT